MMLIQKSVVMSVLVVAALMPNAARAIPIGSFNIGLTGTANPGSQIRITAVADSTTFDSGTLAVGGLTASQIRDLIVASFGTGWSISSLGSNGLTIRGAFTGVGESINPIKFALLQASGFPDVELLTATNEVAFFLAPSGVPIGSINEFSVTGSDLHYSLEIPSEIPEPGTLILLGTGVFAISQFAWRHRLCRTR